LTEGRRVPSRSRSSTTAPMAAAFRSAWGLSDLSDRARRPPPSIARARQCVPANAASSGTSDVSVMPGWVVDLNAEEACSLDAVVEAEIRNSSRPGSQAPHAPPALTFGLPGKQRVKSVQAGCVLIRLVSTLPRNRKVLPMNEPDPCSACCFNNRRRSRKRHYFCARLAASAIWSCRKSANSMP
jgi:hypothetical protein